MKKVASRFKKYRQSASNVRIAHSHIDQIILQTILWSFAALAFIYVSFLGNMVFNIVERKSIEIDLRTLGNEVGELELTFLAMSNDIDLDFSHSLGFREVDATFAVRKANTALGFRSFDSVRAAQNGI